MLRFFDFQVNMRTDQAGRIKAIEVTGRMTGNLEPGLFGVKLTRNAHSVLLRSSDRRRPQGRNADYAPSDRRDT
jgi:hypothetical protein